MTQSINSLREIASEYDAIVFDQWGVLHDGSAPYPGAISAVSSLRKTGTRLAVLSNSGKRSSVNQERISSFGFSLDLFEVVMTSGEALWLEIAGGDFGATNCFPLCARKIDAVTWASGLPLSLVSDLNDAEFVLLMGIQDNLKLSDFDELLCRLLENRLPIYCTNPDRTSPRANGNVVSPGAVAQSYLKLGGSVILYGKPYNTIFKSVEKSLELEGGKLLMVGDSFEHDIVGAANTGWDTLFLQAGIHRNYFSSDNSVKRVLELAASYGNVTPTYTMEMLSQ